MIYKNILISCTPSDLHTADSIKHFLEQNGFLCRVQGEYQSFYNTSEDDPGEVFGWADTLILIVSEAANLSASVRRDVEEAVNCGCSVIPIRVEDIQLSKSLRYYLGPYQWIEAFGNDTDDYLDVLLKALKNSGDTALATADKVSKSKWLRLLVVPATILLIFIIVQFIKADRNEDGRGDPSTETRIDQVTFPDSCDCLIIGDQESCSAYLEDLGYSIFASENYPPKEYLERFDMIILALEGDEEHVLYFYDYISEGGSLLLNGGQPFFMGMPDWLGMRTYSNYYGSDFSITSTRDSLLGLVELRMGDSFIYQSEHMDGGAVLTEPTTAVVDACFNGVDSLAACIRNSIGIGRVAWCSQSGVPFTNTNASGFSTEKYDLYLQALYSWLDRDGPQPF